MDSCRIKYQPGERFGEWLILGRSSKLQPNGKRNFRWCMCMGCVTPHRVQIGNLGNGASSACGSCAAKRRPRLEPKELLKRRFRDAQKRIRYKFRRNELLRWRIPHRLKGLKRGKDNANLSPWMRKCARSVADRRYIPKGNSHKEKVFDNWKESIANQLRRAAKRHRDRSTRLDKWAARCQRAATKCRQRQRQDNG